MKILKEIFDYIFPPIVLFHDRRSNPVYGGMVYYVGGCPQPKIFEVSADDVVIETSVWDTLIKNSVIIGFYTEKEDAEKAVEVLERGDAEEIELLKLRCY